MSWLSCRKYTERLSRSIDEPLGAWDTLGLYFHKCICFTCRRFERQIRLLTEFVNARRDESGVIADFLPAEDRTAEGRCLSKDATERIKRLLANQQQQIS